MELLVIMMILTAAGLLLIGAGQAAWRLWMGALALGGLGPYLWCVVLCFVGQLVMPELTWIGGLGLLLLVSAGVVRFVRRRRAFSAWLRPPQTSRKRRIELD